jgi:hypothetical protein
MIETLFLKINLVISRQKYVIKIMSERFKKNTKTEDNLLSKWESKTDPESCLNSFFLIFKKFLKLH